MPFRRIVPLLLALLSAAHASAQTRQAAGPGAIPYRMVRNRVSGAVLPRISLNTRQARPINTRLDSLAASLRCDPDDVRRGRTEPYESEARVTYAANDVFSVAIIASWYCGGAYPVNGADLSVTYDLRTGREVPFTALWANYARDRRQIIRTLFPSQASAAGRPRPETPNGTTQCDGLFTLQELTEMVDAYSLSPRGITANIDFPHAVLPCGNRTTTPWARVQHYAAPGGILARMARPGGR
ncbi:MAG TPA: hypothetical protein VFJ16_04085 [Longimicrobium sp.]|nr:hypothetical protein [Longimicrobium sp.]